MGESPVTLALCGDVMLGRGVDQVLPRPGDPALAETYVRDARQYVRLAEHVNGTIPCPVDPTWVWGDALAAFDAADPAVRIINLETSVTTSEEFAVGKAVHYRMSPANVPALSAGRPDVCTLANNHVLDFGRPGLEETLRSLGESGLRSAGAGLDAGQAWRPAVIPVDDGRVLVFAVGFATSGIPATWAATADRSGVAYLDKPSRAAAEAVLRHVRAVRSTDDVVVVSVHWGANWGYAVSRDERRFAHQLVDGGVDVVHGHSSHHPRPVEVYAERLVLYGCGDFIDDYEGISGHEEFRDDLRLLYVAQVDAGTGALTELRMVPLQARRMRLTKASDPDTRWLAATMTRSSRGFGVTVDVAEDGLLALR